MVQILHKTSLLRGHSQNCYEVKAAYISGFKDVRSVLSFAKEK